MLLRPYILEYLLRLNLCIKIQTESCLGNPEINVGGNVDIEDDFLIDSKKM